MKYRLIIFDWDGTLADSTAHIVSCIEHACRQTETGYPGDEAARDIIGLGMVEAIETLFGRREPEFIDVFREAYSSSFFSAPISRTDLFEGAVDLLDRLRSAGHLTAIATGKSWRGMSRALECMDLAGHFHAVRCADQTRSKPDPLMLVELLDELKVSSSEAVMVGDTEFDMDMAQRAGIDRIGVSYGAHAAERLHKYAPEAIIDRPQDLLELVVG